MKNYFICYFILQQCLFETLEDDLSKLLCIISPELWENGKPSDSMVFQEWNCLIDRENMTVSQIQKNLSEKLNSLSGDFHKTITVINGENFEYYLSQAEERAKDFIS